MIFPSHPIEAMAIIVADNVKRTMDTACGIGCALRDCAGLSGVHDVLAAFSEENSRIFSDMLETVARIDHQHDLSIRADAKTNVKRLRKLVDTYAPAFKSGGLAHFSFAVLYPRSMTAMVADTDNKWRLALAAVERMAPDEIQLDIIEKLRELLRSSFKYMDEAMHNAMLETPTSFRVSILAKLEADWLEAVATGKDKLEAYDELSRKYQQMEADGEFAAQG